MDDAQGRIDEQQGTAAERIPPLRAEAPGPLSYSTRGSARRPRLAVPAVVVVAGVLLGTAVATLLELL